MHSRSHSPPLALLNTIRVEIMHSQMDQRRLRWKPKQQFNSIPYKTSLESSTHKNDNTEGERIDGIHDSVWHRA